MECRKEVRRNRIKRRDDEIHPASHSGSFDTEIEEKILEGFQELESPKDVDPTENEKKSRRGVSRRRRDAGFQPSKA